VPLHDTAQITVRPIQPADAAQLADTFDRLSQASRRRRFLGVQNDQAGCATPYRDESWA
jgi:hypothetical protein